MAAKLPPSNSFHHSPSAAFHAPGPPPSSTPAATPHTRPVLVATVDIVQLYRRCNPSGFRYQSALNPKRVLTRPSEGVLNGGADNSNSDLILYVNDILQNHSTGHRYQIIDMLGQGTFGQVAKCRHLETGQFVAVKVVKNKLAYFNQGLVEVRILELLNGQYDPSDQAHIVRLREFFVFKKHLCLVFEMLSLNLYELIKQNQFRGLSISLVRIFLSQILKSLSVLTRASVIHCDLKPENILLITPKSPQLKLIDFGSACFEKQTVYSYIQSRFYRSPEVLVGYPYKSAIDMWSLGCIGAELFLGLPLFPGTSEYNQLSRIIDMIGMPPAYLLDRGKSVNKFFHRHGSRDSIGFTYTLKTEDEYARETGTALHPSKKYFNYRHLDDIIMHFPIKSSLTPAQQESERMHRRFLCDFLRGVLNLDPSERWTPEQAARHPFITGNTHVSLPWHAEPAVSLPVSAPITIPTTTATADAARTSGHGTDPAAQHKTAPAAAPAPAAVVAAAAPPPAAVPPQATVPAAHPPPAAAIPAHQPLPPPTQAPVIASAPPSAAPHAAQPPPQQHQGAPQAQQYNNNKDKHRASGSGIAGQSPSRSHRDHQGAGRGRGKHERSASGRNRSQSFTAESTNAGAQTWGLTHADTFKGAAGGPHPPPAVAPIVAQPQQSAQHTTQAPPQSPGKSPQPNSISSPSRRNPPPLSVGSPPVPTPLPDKKNSRLSGTFTSPVNPNTSPRQQPQNESRNYRGPKRRSQNGGGGGGGASDKEEDDLSPGQRGSRGYDQKEMNEKMAALSLTTPPSKPPSAYARAVSKSSSGQATAPPVAPLSPPRGGSQSGHHPPPQPQPPAGATQPAHTQQPTTTGRSQGSSGGEPRHKS